jgi:D-alanyl-D-alanine carboxypeptidase/D-alanyl-D-alanine-endopeptidase (penicillin-binding protein 4)
LRKTYNLVELALAASPYTGGGGDCTMPCMRNITFSVGDLRTGGFVAALAFTSLSCMAQAILPAEVSEALQKGGVPETALSALVIPAGGGTARLAHFDSRPMSTASTMKLVTTLVALEELGPTYQWKTSVLTSARQRGETLQGALYLRGEGDPDLNWDAMRSMLRELRSQGVRHIRGNVVLDRSYFNPARTDIGAPDFDEYPRAYYNVIPDALLVNENFMDFTLNATANKVTVRSEPSLYKVTVRNQLKLIDIPCQAWDDDSLQSRVEARKSGRIQITLSGDFPRNCKQETSLNLLERNQYITRFVRAAWAELGGTWKGVVHEGPTPVDARVLVTHKSPTMARLAALINKPSNNTMTRTVFLSLGELRYQGPALETSRQKGDAVVRAWFARKGIDTRGMVLENGSGLSRIERLTPWQLAALLEEGRKSNWYAEFAASMPIVGVDGTMRNRLKNTPVQGHARMKTGTLNNTSAIAGYVHDQYGKEWTVVAFINTDGARKAGPAVLDVLMQWVYNGGEPHSVP